MPGEFHARATGKYVVGLTLREVRFEDKRARLVESLHGSIRVRNGSIAVERLTGKLGTATVNLAAETRAHLGRAPSGTAGGQFHRAGFSRRSRGRRRNPVSGESPVQELENRLEPSTFR